VDHVVASAPGRVNLIGEHLDYNGGRCLPIAIPQRTTVTAAPSAHGQVSVTSGGLSWSGLPGERAEGWVGYVVGVLWALGVDTALDLTVTSDVPIGAGLSSSAALECATALAVDELLGLGLDRQQVRDACVHAENAYVGAPTGGLDQTASLFATASHALLLDFASGAREQVAFDPDEAGLVLLVVDTRVSHTLNDGGYGDRRAACDWAAAELGVDHLASADLAAVMRLPDPRIRSRARHVVSEQARVGDFVAATAAGDWAQVGALMTASHVSLRDDFEVSCAELDAVVEASSGAGALGARMTGGGFGGSAIVLAPSSRAAVVVEAVRGTFAARGWDAPAVMEVEASRGAEVHPAT
jgi:galactokinase